MEALHGLEAGGLTTVLTLEGGTGAAGAVGATTGATTELLEFVSHFWFLLTSPFLVMESGWGAVRLVEKVSCMAISLLLMDIVPVEAFFACKILIVDNIFSNSA